jgi:hypothetical protein
LGEVVIAWRMSAPQTSGAESLTVPLCELDRFDGTRSDPVTLEVKSTRRGIAKWRDRTGPRSTNFELTKSDVTWPAEPDQLTALPPEFVPALHEAGRSASREESRYALARIQVRGRAGQLVATDGKQALVQGGFTFPFAEDLLVPALPVFGTKEVSVEREVGIGVVDNWLYLAIGPWQVWLAIDREGRFPDVESAIPKAPGTRVVFAEADARRLLDALPRLRAGNDDNGQAVTLDLGRRVAVRAREGPNSEIVEVLLPESKAAGPEVVALVSRENLVRALSLGLKEFRCSDPNRPLVAKDANRTFVMATFDPKLAVPAARDKITNAAPVRVTVNSIRPQTESPDYPRSPDMARESPIPERNGHHGDQPNGEALDPLLEAEALRAALVEAANRSNRLVNALKQYRKERRALQSAFTSLRQLNLGN